MVVVAQLVRVLVCGTEGRRFEPGHPPEKVAFIKRLFYFHPTNPFVMFFLYILKSNSTGKHYIGQTNDLEKRIVRHNSNQNKSTKNRGPWELIYSKAFETRGEAMLLEGKLKAYKNPSKVREWIESQE